MNLLTKIYPPTWLLIAIIIMALFGFMIPEICVIPWPLRLLALPLLASGIVIACWASHLFKRAKTAIQPDHQPSEMIATGPYCFSRHPMYLGFVMFLVGLAIGLGNVLTFVVVAGYAILMDRCFIKSEESNMERIFGERYTVYKKLVRRWI
jgi:protein-S-isoprenylcysteine O-methyltransferase Ste14